MRELERLVTVNKLSQKDPNWIHKDLFRLLHKDELWITAYENIKGNKGVLTPGSTLETMDGMSLRRLKRLQEQVCSETYKFKAVKLIYIPAKSGKKRPLGLPTANDKIVQEVIRLILEAIYEPVFCKESFGFRQGRGCHDALDHVEQRFRWVDYAIEGDIEQAYPIIDHHILIKTLNKRINDPRFIRLIWKLLGCGVLDEERITWSKSGVPQGSIVSPILANIYYHELDEFVQSIKQSVESENISKIARKSKAYKALEYKIQKIHNEIKEYKLHSMEKIELKSLKY